MSLRDKFKVDSALAASGVWLVYGKNEDGTIPRFLVARMTKHNKKYTKSMRKAAEPYTDKDGAVDLMGMDDDDADTMLFDVFNESVLLGWEHFQPEDDGTDLEYSKENSKEVIGSLDWLDFYQDLEAKAKKAATFSVTKMEADAKNS